ncbi:hypothetical protein QJS10_CPB17g02260 [Acorus calamus]|uniref:Uncharacterized protein n=1 Tax=Acorus calamus TaxID=4465 RepID=A0AAV9CSH3_ACOCL|nr:hypothetical protein QJS10_CPB17g02260 [Acorus calamus]
MPECESYYLRLREAAAAAAAGRGNRSMRLPGSQIARVDAMSPPSAPLIFDRPVVCSSLHGLTPLRGPDSPSRL